MRRPFPSIFALAALAWLFIFCAGFSFFQKDVSNLFDKTKTHLPPESSIVVGNILVYQPSELLGLFPGNGWRARLVFKNEDTGKEYVGEVSLSRGDFAWSLPPGKYKVVLTTLHYFRRFEVPGIISLRDPSPLSFELSKNQIRYLGHYYYEVGPLKPEIASILTKRYVKRLTASLIRTVSDKSEMILSELKAERSDLVTDRDFSKTLPEISQR